MSYFTLLAGLRARVSERQLEALMKTFPALSLAEKTNAVPRTEDITLISHDHGRDRRIERTIDKKELQAAIKYGIKTSANPGRDGSQRWRYTYNNVVYITDTTYSPTRFFFKTAPDFRLQN